MDFESASKKIGDCEYTLKPLGFGEARKALVRLGNVAGPLLGALGGVKDLAGMLPAFGKILSTLRDEDLQFFQGVFAPKTIVALPSGGKAELEKIIELHFAPASGRLYDFVQWLAWCLVVNYGPFFQSLAREGQAQTPTDASP